MEVKKRLVAFVLAALALALSVAGIMLAATDANPAGLVKDPLALNGYPPSSAALIVHLSSGPNFNLSANLGVDFTKSRVDAVVSIPTVLSSAAVELRLVAGHLYARSAAQSSGPWMDAKVKTLALFGVALELTRPDVRLITGFRETVTKRGFSTTYVLHRNHVALTDLFASSATSVLGSVLWTITVGSQGEVSSSSVTVKSAHVTTSLSVIVSSYNQPVRIMTPTDVKSIPITYIDKLVTGKGFPTLLIPRDVTSLSRASLS